MKTTENNKLIAEFMGLIESSISNKFWTEKNSEGFGIGQLTELKYDTDWNWLMSVVEKILDISLELDSMEMYYNITDNIPYINSTYNACIEFIKWYNENKLNN
jgi:hypothetical protein